MTKARDLADLGNKTSLDEINDAYDAGALSNRNMVTNGAMVIDQRNGASAISSLGQYTTYTLDRWQYFSSQSGKFSFQQNQSSVTPPVGFTKYLGLTSLSAYSLGTNETVSLSQHVEGFNCAQLNWGTSNAKTVSLSFWVRSSLTGTFSGVLAGGQNYIYTYDISSANTWEYKTITINGSTTGTWNTGNTSGIRVLFTLGYGSGQVGTANAWQSADFAAAGSVQVVGTSGATFQITGVQLEVGDTATPFEHGKSYGEELAKCQRYYREWGGNSGNERIAVGFYYSTSGFRTCIDLNPEMRTSPTLSVTSHSQFHTEYNGGSAVNTFHGLDQASPKVASVNVTTTRTASGGMAGQLMCNSTAARLKLDAEL